MSEKKPEYAFMMSLIGGIFILVDGAVGLMMGIRYGSWGIWIWEFPDSALILGPIGVVLGTLILVAAMMGYKKTDKGLITGAVVIAMSIASFVLMMGGYVVGFGFALIGGILFVVWEPGETKNCLRCGKEIKLDTWNCPHCGYMYYQPYPYYPSPQYQQAQPQAQGQPPATGQKFCMQCGAGLDEGAAFCSNCGQRT